MPGSIEDDDHKVNPISNPWHDLVSKEDPAYTKMSRRVLAITSEERRRIAASAAQSRQKWRAREQETYQRRAKQESMASGSGNRSLATSRSWVKQEYQWTTKADETTEAAPVVPQGSDTEMTEVASGSGLGYQDTTEKPLSGASKAQGPIHPKEIEFLEEARRAMFDESERERLQAQTSKDPLR